MSSPATAVPKPADEIERLLALYRYQLLDTPEEETFDSLTRLTAAITGAPRVQLNLIDAERQWTKSTFGIERHECPRSAAFCTHTILQNEVMCVPDARLDARFSDNAAVQATGAGSIRFYAGAPLQTADGHNLGALCIIDTKPRPAFGPEQEQMLRDLSALAVTLIESRLDTIRRTAAERVKDEFIATVSHELRTPLTSLDGALRLVESGAVGALPDKIARLVKIAASNAARLTALVNDVLDLERGEAKGLTLRRETLNPRQAIDEALMTLEPYAADYKVHFTVLDVTEQVRVAADPGRLQQILGNLLSNAIKFSPSGGMVTIKIEPRLTDVLISISDKGAGIPESFQNRVFEKFTQADTSNHRQKGSGLGLSIARLCWSKRMAAQSVLPQRYRSRARPSFFTLLRASRID